jgi:hypothetical protein
VIVHAGCDCSPEVARWTPVPRSGGAGLLGRVDGGQPGAGSICSRVIIAASSPAQGACAGRCRRRVRPCSARRPAMLNRCSRGRSGFPSADDRLCRRSLGTRIHRKPARETRARREGPSPLAAQYRKYLKLNIDQGKIPCKVTRATSKRRVEHRECATTLYVEARGQNAAWARFNRCRRGRSEQRAHKPERRDEPSLCTCTLSRFQSRQIVRYMCDPRRVLAVARA